jgi:hypothetical protein
MVLPEQVQLIGRDVNIFRDFLRIIRKKWPYHLFDQFGGRGTSCRTVIHQGTLLIFGKFQADFPVFNPFAAFFPLVGCWHMVSSFHMPKVEIKLPVSFEADQEFINKSRLKSFP